MKWPASLTLVRHAESRYNDLKKQKEAIPEWKDFTKAFNKGYNAKDFEERVLEGLWPNTELIDLTRRIYAQVRKIFGSYSDIETPLTERGWEQSRMTGRKLRAADVEVPDIIHVSPYLRPHQTLEGMQSEWPALRCVRVVEEERIREQEHGLQTLCGDWRIFSVLNPASALLRKKTGPYYFQYPQGESVCEVRERNRDFLSMLIREHAEQRIWAVTHHLTILSTRANLERWDHKRFEHADENEKPLNCGVTMYKGDPSQGKDGKLILTSYNQIYY